MAARRGGAGAGRKGPAPAGGSGAAGAEDRGTGAQVEDPGSAARDHCIRLLAVRPRTRAELETALRRRGFDDDVIAEVLARYSDVGMIDDEAFARAWVTSRHHSKGLARRALAGELRRKGVADEDVGVALDELGDDTEAATARALVERRLRTERAAARRSAARRAAGASGRGESEPERNEPGDRDSAEQLRQREHAALMRKLVGMLARKGYPPGLAFRVVKEAVQDTVDSDVAELLDPDSYVEDLDNFDQLRS
jgi:regulatory protein